jgi:multiple antibiotic resistance protein
VQETEEETRAGADKQDIAITPLGIPMLAGPGAISTALLLRARAETAAQHVALYLCIVVVCAASYVVLRLSTHGARWLGPIGMKITTRVMGLLLAAVAFQFLIDALRDLKVLAPA